MSEHSCDVTIYNDGTPIACFDAGKIAMEGLVREACRGGLRMDWHYVGGLAVVKTLDDPADSLNILLTCIPRKLSVLAE